MPAPTESNSMSIANTGVNPLASKNRTPLACTPRTMFAGFRKSGQEKTETPPRQKISVIAFHSPAIAQVLRGVIRGVAKDARTRGFPSPSYGGFGFIYFSFVVPATLLIGYQIAPVHKVYSFP
jgi:hypothetical protein